MEALAKLVADGSMTGREWRRDTGLFDLSVTDPDTSEKEAWLFCVRPLRS